jgi:hypothetical protein
MHLMALERPTFAHRFRKRQFSFGRGDPLAHDPEPSLAGRHQLIAICVHEEQKMQATLTSQPSNEDKTTAACVNRRYQSPTHHLAADSD